MTVKLDEQESELVFCQGSHVEGEEEVHLMEDCHCILVVFSVTDLDSLREGETLLQSLWQSGHLNTKAVIVVGNKTDLVRAREVPIDGEYCIGLYPRQGISSSEARCIASSHDCKYVEVSAGLNHNVDKLLVNFLSILCTFLCSSLFKHICNTYQDDTQVGIVKQVRLKMNYSGRTAKAISPKHGFLANR